MNKYLVRCVLAICITAVIVTAIICKASGDVFGGLLGTIVTCWFIYTFWCG